MLYAITLDEIIDANQQLDIYAFMRSPEIRNYMRHNKTFEIKDKIYIILKSMDPFPIKLNALHILASDSSLSNHDRKHVLYTARYVERILQEIYQPSLPAIIALKECYSIDSEELNSYESSVIENNSTNYFASYKEFIDVYSEYAPEIEDEIPRFEIDLVYQGLDNRHNNPISFSATWFDGKIEIYSISEDPYWGEEHCFNSSITDYFWCGWMGRYSLPYPTMSKVKIQTPFMTKPLSGIIDSSLDGCGCWYHFFYPFDARGLTGEFMDFSYHGLELSGDFSVFDWISSDVGEVSSEDIMRIRKFDNILTPIAELAPNISAIIIGKSTCIVTIEKSGWKEHVRIIHVKLEDATGQITVPITVSRTDVNWLINAVEKKMYIKLGITTILDNDGDIEVKYTGDISLITEKDYYKYLSHNSYQK